MRAAILDAADRLIAAEGPGGLTMADVALQLRVAQTTLTYYFRRHEDLAAAAIERTGETA